MARISTGKAYGDTSRRTSQRLLGGMEATTGVALAQQGINAPRLQPAASPVNTFQQSGAATLGGPVQMFAPPRLPEPNQDMANLATALGSFNPALRGIGEMYVLKQKELDKSRQEEAMQFAQQATSLAGPYTGVADLQLRLEKKAGEGDAGAQRLLQYMVSRHPGMFAYLAESAQENAILVGASSLTSKMRSVATIPDGQGGELEIDALQPDDPRLQQWIQRQVISDAVVSPRVYAKHQNLMIAAQNNAREVHEGRHIGHRVKQFKADTSLKVGALADGYLNNTFNVAQVTGQMQSLLDDPRFVGLPQKEREQLIDGLWDTWEASLRAAPGAADAPLDPEKALAPFMSLMVGPESQRFKPDGTPNENLLLVARLGGAAWIDQASAKLQTGWLQQYNRNEQVEEIGARNYANDLIEQNMSPEIMKNPDLAAAARESALQAIQSDPNMTLEQKAKASAMVDKAYTDRDEAFNSEGRRDRELSYDLQLARAYQDPQYAVQMQRQIEEDVRLRRISDSKASSLLGSIAQFQNSNSKPFKEQLDSLITAKRNEWKLNSQAASSYDGQAVGEFETNSWARAESQMLEEGTRIVREGMAAGKPSTQINDDLANLFKSRNFGLRQRQVPVDQTQLYKSPQELIQKNRQGWASSSIPPEKAAYLKGQARVKPLVDADSIAAAADAAASGKALTPEMKELLRAVTTGPNRMKPSEFFIKQLRFQGIDVPPEQMQQLQKLDETFRVSSAPAGARPQVAAWQNPFLGMVRNLGNTAMNVVIPPAQAAGGPSNERWMQDLSRLPASRGTLPPPPPGGGRAISGGGMTGIVTYYTGSGGSDGVAGGPTANGERYNPNAMTVAVQRSLRGKYLNKWLLVEDLDTGKSVRVWANDVGSMGGTDNSINRQDPRIVDLSPAAFKQLYGSLDRGTGRIRVRIDPNQRGQSPSRVRASAEPNEELGSQFIAQLEAEGGYEDTAGPAVQRKPWAGEAGQFAAKGSFQNGLDAINKAGASVMGFLQGKSNDIELVTRFYSKNPEVANQYDLPVNLFVRYISGIGAKGLKVSQAQGQKVLKQIEAAKQNLPAMVAWTEQNMLPAYAASYKRNIAKGMIPVSGFGARDQEIDNSLGRFWAVPQKDGSYLIKEDFNFSYAPKKQGGNDKRAAMVGGVGIPSLNPAAQARELVTSGHGKPFKYTLRVSPDGKVQVSTR